MKVNKKYINKPVIIEFLDHTNFDKPVRCRAIGWIAEIGKDYIKLMSWDVDTEDQDFRYNNAEFITIISGAIQKLDQLKPVI